MEDSFIRYRKASIKGKLIMCKRFVKYYFNDYRPLTHLEASDLNNSRTTYRAYTACGAIVFGFVSFRMRRAGFGAAGTQGVSKENNLPLYILNDMTFGFIGYMLGAFFAHDLIYKQR